MYDNKATPQGIIEKIRKLMALADNNNNAAEAELAAAKAQALIQQYNIDMAAIAQASGNVHVDIIDSFAEFKLRRQSWNIWLASTVGDGFMTETLTTPTHALFIGRPHDVEISCYMFDRLQTIAIELSLSAFKRFTKQFKADNGVSFRDHFDAGYQTKRLNWLDNYKEGFVIGLQRQINERKRKFEADNANSTALVPINAIEAYTQAKYNPKEGRKRKKTDVDTDARNAGFEAGKNASLSAGITHKARRELQ